MTKDKALKLALEALENFKEVVVAAQVLGIKVGATGKNMRLGESFLHDEAITAIKAALAQPEQEPVTWMCKAFDGEACEQSNHDECENPIPLYATPPKQEWVGLTDEETAECFEARIISDRLKADAARIEARLKEKNT